ncbi:hypothetical protein MNAN1_001010 [Malassezia nana]|uniref:FAD dependent oxidoreductase domain-containing protein n=1 Tax=Malassezia nana TaxID=180528 RepID=A0AAF0J6H4_9BASI|nr:hypothetical protein MNAN1_001010 [Malassezia nana]
MSAFGHILIIGAGAFGASAALELEQLAHRVTVLDQSPDGYASVSAASHDLNKIIRSDYTIHPLYAPHFHEVGIFFRSGQPSSVDAPWIKAGVENALQPVAHAFGTPEAPSPRPTARAITTAEESVHLFPEPLRPHLGPTYTSFGHQAQVGYFNPQAGWANARDATFAVLAEAQRLGATVHSNVQVVRFLYASSPGADGKPRVCGAVASDGRTFCADHVVLAAGSWMRSLLDQCQLPLPPGLLKPSAHCVVTLQIQPKVAKLFRGTPVLFDMNTGMYAFEPNAQGILKCAIHGTGSTTPEPTRTTQTSFPAADGHPHVNVMLWELQKMYPVLRLNEPGSPARIHYTRICWYCDTRDENFLIDFHPAVDGLLVALIVSRLLGIQNDTFIAPDYGLSEHQRRVFSFAHHTHADARVNVSVPIDSMRIGNLPPAKVPSPKL